MRAIRTHLGMFGFNEVFMVTFLKKEFQGPNFQ